VLSLRAWFLGLSADLWVIIGVFKGMAGHKEAAMLFIVAGWIMAACFIVESLREGRRDNNAEQWRNDRP
jgi:hypothetical protein